MIEYQTLEEHDCFVARASGTIRDEDLLNFKQVLSGFDDSRTHNALYDFSEVSGLPRISHETLRALAERSHRAPPILDRKVAILVSSPALYALALVLVRFLQNRVPMIRAFRDRREALGHVGISGPIETRAIVRDPGTGELRWR